MPTGERAKADRPLEPSDATRKSAKRISARVTNSVSVRCPPVPMPPWFCPPPPPPPPPVFSVPSVSTSPCHFFHTMTPRRYLKCKFTTLSRMLYDEWKGCRDWTPPEMVYPRLSSEPSFDVSSFDVSSFDVSSFDVSSFDVSSFDVSSFDVSSFDVSSFDVSSFEPPADHFQPQLPRALAPSRRFTSVAAGAGIGMVAGLGMVVGLLALRRGRKRVR